MRPKLKKGPGLWVVSMLDPENVAPGRHGHCWKRTRKGSESAGPEQGLCARLKEFTRRVFSAGAHPNQSSCYFPGFSKFPGK